MAEERLAMTEKAICVMETTCEGIWPGPTLALVTCLPGNSFILRQSRRSAGRTSCAQELPRGVESCVDTRGREHVENRRKNYTPSKYNNKTERCPTRPIGGGYIVYASIMAVIFKGSCEPLYSSPMTKGISNPGLALLICG